MKGKDATEAEYPVLAAVDAADGQVGRPGLADYTCFMECSLEQALQEYEQAIQLCLSRGWLKVLTEEDCYQDRVRWREEPNQVWTDQPYEVGRVDFTLEGWNQYRQLQKARLAKGAEDPLGQGVLLHRTRPRRIEAYGGQLLAPVSFFR